jgi:hypothetical protein
MPMDWTVSGPWWADSPDVDFEQESPAYQAFLGGRREDDAMAVASPRGPLEDRLRRPCRWWLVASACLMLFGCSGGGPPSGSGRVTGYVGPGRPGDNTPIPSLTLRFSDGRRTVETTVEDGRYTVDLPAGTWEVHSDDDNVCATGLRVVAAASQRNDLIWPSGSCQDHSGPPTGRSPPVGPTPPRT